MRATACSTRWQSSVVVCPANVPIRYMDDTDATPATNERKHAALRIVVADDNALLREGIASLLEDAGHGSWAGQWTRTTSCSRSAPTRRTSRSSTSGCRRATDDGLVAAAEIRAVHPGVGVLVLSQHLEPAYMLELVGDEPAGVGYLLKDRVRDVAEFLDAVDRVAAGGTAFDPEVVKALVGGRQRWPSTSSPSASAPYCSCRRGPLQPAIAKQLYLEPRAVERHVAVDLREAPPPRHGGRQPPRARRPCAARPVVLHSIRALPPPHRSGAGVGGAPADAKLHSERV